jgi:peptide/nickel transport system permease protein
LTDIFLAFPGLILAMAVAAALGRNWTNLMIALMVVWWPGYARLIRGQVLVEKEKLYVEAARSVGAGRLRIAFRHVLPNSIFPLLVAVTLDIGSVMLTAAGLSFIGFGAEPGTAELGRMVSDGRPYLFSHPWIVMFPGIVMLITAVGFNLIGDGLRDVLDPRLRR